MIVEALAIAVPWAAGTLFVMSVGARGWGVAPIGLLVGYAAEILATWSLAMVSVPARPVLVWGVVVSAAACSYGVGRRRGTSALPAWWAPLAAAGAALALAAGTTVARVFSWHVDTLEYLQTSRVLAVGQFAATSDHNILGKRLLGYAALQIPAELGARDLLIALSPSLGIAAVATVVWALGRHASHIGASATRAAWPIGLTVIALVTTNRFVFHTFYLNGHMLVASLACVVGVWAWDARRAAEDGKAPAAGLLLAALLAMPAMIVTRTEGTIVAALLLVPVIAMDGIPRRVRAAATLTWGASTALWFGWTGVLEFVRGDDWKAAIVVSLCGAAAPVVVLLAPRNRVAARAVSRAVPIAAWSLAFAVVAVFVVNPRSAAAGFASVWWNAVRPDSYWGPAFTLIALLFIASVVGVGSSASRALTLAVATFIPAGVVLSIPAHNTFRHAVVDSLNRMIIEVVPLALLVIGVAVLETVTQRFERGVASGSTRPAPRGARRSARR